MEDLLERLSHGEVTDKNLTLLKDYCSSITNKYKEHPLFRRHLDEFITSFNFSPIFISEKIKNALDLNLLPEYKGISGDNIARIELISELISNKAAKDKLIELKKGYYVFAPDTPDELINKGFSIETAIKFIDNFEKCLYEHKDNIEALRIIYNSEKKLITYTMLRDLQDKLLSYDRTYLPYNIWKNYARIDNNGNVSELNQKRNVNALTNLIQIVRYAFEKDNKLTSLYGLFNQRFNLYVGSNNHTLNEKQIEIMKKIAEYIVDEGAIDSKELNSFDTDLWRQGITVFGAPVFASEIQMLSKYIIGVAA